MYPADATKEQTLEFYLNVGTMGPLGSETIEYPHNFGPYKIDIKCYTTTNGVVKSEITVSAP